MSKEYDSVKKIRETYEKQSEWQKFSTFRIDDDKETHTISEIRNAAIQQGYIAPAVQNKPNSKQTARANQNKNALDSSAFGVMRLTSDTPSYHDTSAEINRLSHVKSHAERRGEDTSAFNRAIQMLQNYADGFSPD